MLVVTRKIDEGIVIDENIHIVVLGIEDGRVKLGITAPADKKIYREEVYEAIKQENREALKAGKDAITLLTKKE